MFDSLFASFLILGVYCLGSAPLQVIRHLRTNKSCGGASTSVTQRSREAEARPLEPRLPHRCFQCRAELGSKAELRSHQRSHRSKPVYHCSHCQRCFQHLSALSNHRQMHLAPPTHLCSLCPQAFASQALLLRHLQAHSAQGAEPQYSCRFCQRSFKGTVAGREGRGAVCLFTVVTQQRTVFLQE